MPVGAPEEREARIGRLFPGPLPSPERHRRQPDDDAEDENVDDDLAEGHASPQ